MPDKIKIHIPLLIYYAQSYNDDEAWFKRIFIQLAKFHRLISVKQCDISRRMINIASKLKYIKNIYNNRESLFGLKTNVEKCKYELLIDIHYRKKCIYDTGFRKFKDVICGVYALCNNNEQYLFAINETIGNIENLIYKYNKDHKIFRSHIIVLTIRIKILFKQLELTHKQIYNELNKLLIDDSIKRNLYRLDQIFGSKKDCEYMELMDTNVIYRIICEFISDK